MRSTLTRRLRQLSVVALCAATALALATGGRQASAIQKSEPANQSVNAVSATHPAGAPLPFSQINHFIVIYQENWSFDALYGNFPGANGYNNVPASSPAGSVSAAAQLAANPRIDVFSTAYGQPFIAANRLVPQPINGSTPDGNFAAFNGLPQPYLLSDFISPGALTGDIVHRFHTEIAQIDGGKMDKFVSLSDNPGLVLSGFDATNMPEGFLAQQYVMCDNFFHAAFGGSFLNHQWLIAAQSPVYANAPANLVQPAGATTGFQCQRRSPGPGEARTGPVERERQPG